MSSRRKSARPTNKVRHQVEVEDDDDQEDMLDSKTATTVIPVSKISTSSEMVQMKMVPKIISSPDKVPSRPMPQPQNSATAHSLVTPQTSEPLIVLPSDIYHDFEALKSVTKLDTTELMRKLLKDYQKLASCSHSSRERKLDDVIGDLVAARSSTILDLSKPKGVTARRYNDYHIGTNSAAKLGQGYTDDQLVMGVYNEDDQNTEDGDEKDSGDDDDCKPLDLTLQKQDLAPSPDSAIVEDIHVKTYTPSSLFPMKTYATSNDDASTYQSSKPAGSYVINLEPPSPPASNSSLAQALQMNTPLHSPNKIQNYTIGPPEDRISMYSSASQSGIKKTTPVLSSIAGTIFSPSHTFRDIKTGSPVVHKTTLSSDSLPCRIDSASALPTYAEALSSVLCSGQNARKQIHADFGKEASATSSELGKNTVDCQPSTISFLHMNGEEADIKLIPIGTQLLSTNCSARDPSKQPAPHQMLQKHLLQQHVKPDHKPHQQQQSQQQPTATQHQNPVHTFCSNQIQQIHMLPLPGIKSEQNDVQGVSAKNADVSFPNFLLDPHSLAVSAISTALTNVTAASNTVPLTSMPMPTFFMTASTNGGMGNMVAIPVIHALPEGMQPFAFAPHPIPPTSSTPSAPTQISPEMVPASTTTAPTADTPNLLNSTLTQSRECSMVMNTSEAAPSSPLNSGKPKPGRPRGRGGRGPSQKTQNKDMKLLTENTLFPGVYTSILKLPWSRRSRNKTKSKTISELKKQAQMIAHQKVHEDGDHFIGESDNQNDHLNIDQEYNTDIKDNPDRNQPQASHLQHPIPQEQQQPQQHQPQHHHQQQQQQQQQQRSLYEMQLQKQKDLEQQQRLHFQYHLRLQEEQRKLAKQIEESYLNSGQSSPLPISVAFTGQLTSLVKQEIPTTEYPQSSGNLPTPLPLNIHPTSDSAPQNSQQALPLNEYVGSGYTKTDAGSPKKLTRKRGRPPKISSLSTTGTDEQLSSETLASSVLGNTSQQQEVEPDNFLTNTFPSNPLISVFDTPGLSNLLSSTDTPSQGRISVIKHSSSEEMEVDTNNHMALDKKITFLTNQIGLEMTKSTLPQMSVSMSSNNSQDGNETMEAMNDDDTLQQEMKLVSDKSLVGVKPRRKKVSRLLKSDENFMYATFKIKPKGLTPRKSRRKRKDVLANTAAAAETIANLRQKTLQDCLTSTSTIDNSKSSSMVSWKFHEQYPHSNEEKKTGCVTCGNIIVYGNEETAPGQCETCFLEHSESSLLHEENEPVDSKAVGDVVESELRAECCVNCGSIFQKHYSDPCKRCDTCRQSTPAVIKSSKLFSLHDYVSELPATSTVISSDLIPSRLVLTSDNSSIKENPRLDKGLAQISNNHLYCSVCRMGFSKICDYLAHIRDTHETNTTENKLILLNDPVATADLTSSRKPKVSKTKKSLAHKTLTCPVEDCPHFFREQKDLDLHFSKKHGKQSPCPHTDCGYLYSTTEELDNHLRFDHDPSITVKTTGNQTATNSRLGDDESINSGTERSCIGSEKPLQCEFCDYRCRQRNALTWHMRKHPEAASQYRRYNSIGLD